MNTVKRSEVQNRNSKTVQKQVSAQSSNALKKYAYTVLPIGILFFFAALYAMFVTKNLSWARVIILAYMATLIVLALLNIRKVLEDIRSTIKKHGQDSVSKIFVYVALSESAFVFCFLSMLLYIFSIQSPNGFYQPLFFSDDSVDLICALAFFVFFVVQYALFILTIAQTQKSVSNK